jgi:hypothetical protein
MTVYFLVASLMSGLAAAYVLAGNVKKRRRAHDERRRRILENLGVALKE